MGVLDRFHCTYCCVGFGKEEQEECVEEGQLSRVVRQLELDPSGDGSQFLDLGSGLFCLQRGDAQKSIGLVGQVYHDHVCSIGLWTGLCTGCGVFRLHLSRIHGQFQMVGHRDLQAGMRLAGMSLYPPQTRRAIRGLRRAELHECYM